MKSIIYSVSVAGALVLAANANVAKAAELPTTHINMVGTSAGSPPWLIEEAFWKDIEKKTDGKLSASIQSMTELGIKGPEIFRLTKLGVINIAMSSLSYSSGDLAENDSLDPPGLVPDLSTMKKGVDSYRSTLDKIYEERLGLKLLGLWPLAAQVLWMGTPISGLADLKGKKIRVSGIAKADVVRALGAIPTTMPFAEVVPALQRGVIDGAITGTAAGNLAKWTEVTTHLYPLVFGWGIEAQAANLKWWNKLDPRAQKLIQEQMDDMSDIGWQQADVGTNNGIWCTVGDSRCDVKATAPKLLNQTKLTLVEVTEADIAKLKKTSLASAMPIFANRCGGACVDNWNAKLSKIYGVTLPIPTN